MNRFAYQRLDGKTAVVTGSSSGIGRAVALALADAGADVVVHAGSRADSAEQVAAEIEQAGRRTHVIVHDLADASRHAAFVDQAWAWQPIDIWINNAGVDVLTGDRAQWRFEDKLESLWKVDVAATIHLSRNVGLRMRSRGGGAIVNIGWSRSEQGMGGDSGEMFSAAKGAVAAFSRSLAASLAPEVRVNCVAPGWIQTAWGQGASDYWQQRAQQESLLGRWGTSLEVARVCRFLASSEAAFVNGQVIHVDGGFAPRALNED